MKNIFVIGAGRSASSLIKYLLDNSTQQNWNITIADADLKLAEQKCNNYKNAKAIQFDATNEMERQKEIQKTDIVVSLLPPTMHIIIAYDCLKFKKHLVTASYVSTEMQALHEEAKKNNLIFLNEVGLDPGIDHMSAMQVIDKIKNEGGEFTSFKSYCGGLIAPESNDNPWGYKFTWNPRNVILAGQAGAQFIENGKLKEFSYKELFNNIETVTVDRLGKFDAYANRDSLSYRKPYGLENIPTMLRGTLRMKGFCKAWDVFVQAGLTDDTYKVSGSDKMSYAEWVVSLLHEQNIQFKTTQLFGKSIDSETMQKIEWTGILSDEKIKLADATPAQILQELLERKWNLKEHDKDMIVMQHQFVYRDKNRMEQRLTSSLIVKGEDQTYTAMAKTVGLPMAIAVKLIANDKIKERGVIIPISKEIYEPILNELETLGIKFLEK